jgi:hypothetical protein
MRSYSPDLENVPSDIFHNILEIFGSVAQARVIFHL